MAKGTKTVSLHLYIGPVFIIALAIALSVMVLQNDVTNDEQEKQKNIAIALIVFAVLSIGLMWKVEIKEIK